MSQLTVPHLEMTPYEELYQYNVGPVYRAAFHWPGYPGFRVQIVLIDADIDGTVVHSNEQRTARQAPLEGRKR